MTARNPGEDSQREILPHPADRIEIGEKKIRNPKQQLKNLNSIDSVFEAMGSKMPVVIEVKDEKIENSIAEEAKKREAFDSIS